ncbi:MAG: primase-helicase zinc-binding domain-containing protein, partial [Planctomycetota bacterium]
MTTTPTTTRSATAGNGCYDKDLVKQAAAGRWAEIITALTGIDAEYLDGRHHRCPKCGGKDRFRWDREKEFALCNGCFSEGNGDGFAAIQHFRGVGFPEAVALVGQRLGLQPSRNGRTKAKGKKKGMTYASIGAAASAVARGLKGKPAGSWQYDTFSVVRIDTPTPEGAKQEKEFRPVHPITLSDGRTAYRLGYPDGKRPLYRRAELEAAEDISLVTVCAGEKATDAAVKLGLTVTTNAGGEKAVGQTDWKPLLRFEAVVVVIDNDPAGERFGQLVVAALFKLKADVKVIILRLPDLPPKGDIVEWIDAGGGKGEFLALVDAAVAVTVEEAAGWVAKSSGPRILVGFDEARVADEAIRAITKESNLYQRGGKLVQVVTDAKPPRGLARPEGAPRIAMLRQARLREIMAEHAKWAQPTDDGYVPCHVPRWAVEAVSAREQWEGIRPVEGV